MERSLAERLVRGYSLFFALVTLAVTYLVAIGGIADAALDGSTGPVLSDWIIVGISALLVFALGAWTTYGLIRRKRYGNWLAVTFAAVCLLLSWVVVLDAPTLGLQVLAWIILAMLVAAIYLFGFNGDVKALFTSPSQKGVHDREGSAPQDVR